MWASVFTMHLQTVFRLMFGLMSALSGHTLCSLAKFDLIIHISAFTICLDFHSGSLFHTCMKKKIQSFDSRIVIPWFPAFWVQIILTLHLYII